MLNKNVIFSLVTFLVFCCFGFTIVNNQSQQQNQNEHQHQKSKSSTQNSNNNEQFQAESSIVENQFIVFFRQYLSNEKQSELLHNFLNSDADLVENQCTNQESGIEFELDLLSEMLNHIFYF